MPVAPRALSVSSGLPLSSGRVTITPPGGTHRRGSRVSRLALVPRPELVAKVHPGQAVVHALGRGS